VNKTTGNNKPQEGSGTARKFTRSSTQDFARTPGTKSQNEKVQAFTNNSSRKEELPNKSLSKKKLEV